MRPDVLACHDTANSAPATFTSTSFWPAPSSNPAAASRHLIQHRGRALVFDSIEDFHTCIDDPELDVEADAVLVLRGCGPKGYVAPRLRPLALVQTG
jgi:hypothetical protein